jgi:hypothetical protein
MANPIWSTPGGSLGVVPENEFFQIQLEASDPAGGNVTYRSLAGSIPPGMQITRSGSLQGVPVVTDVTNTNRNYEFSIRAQDPNGLVNDRTFNLTITNIVPPQITPRVTSLGEVFDGIYYSLQLHATEVNPQATLAWDIIGGSLPSGLSLSKDGLISGFILPIPTVGNPGTAGFNASPYNEFSYDQSTSYQNNSYTFTVRVFDGINYDSLTYRLIVISKSTWEADTTLDTTDSQLTIDYDTQYVPILLTPAQALPTVRSNSKFAFQFQAADPNNNEFEYILSQGAGSGFDADGTVFDGTRFDQSEYSLPTGLSIDPNTGWLIGTLGSQVEAEKTYTFEIYAAETAPPYANSVAIQYTMTVLGDITNTITWNTSANLGIIDNGSVSQLSVSATSNAGKNLIYSLVTDKTHLPQGLKLLPSGLIVGRTTFEYFSLDKNTTTIDGATTTVDNTYNFTVQATSTDGTVSSTKRFTILINNFNKTPYENLYLKALPTLDQRQTFLSIVNNTEIFPDNLIYRNGDPYFGRAQDIRSLFLSGLTPSQLSAYTSAMSTNTYNKRIEFSNIKTARAVDANFNTKYEVVYVELKDDAMNQGSTPVNYYYNSTISANVYPNSFDNMSSVISSNLGFANQGALPGWMTSPQIDKKTLGFTRAIVLAYTIPGASNLIAYRLKSNGITFNNIDFVADRYDLDNVLSKNYNTTTGKFITSKETTFDRIVRPGAVAYTVDYGVRGLAFDMINGQSVASIQARGGLDGVLYFQNGQTLIFTQQESYAGELNANDGWNLNGAAVPGYNDYINSSGLPNGTSGFPSNPVQNQTVTVNNILYVFTNYNNQGVLLATGVWRKANQRSGIWTINISDTNIVTLTFSKVIQVGTRVQINYGVSKSNSIVLYNPILQIGQSVPAYTSLSTMLSSSNTRFDNYGTKFLSNRDQYTGPELSDTWLKFPKRNMLQ